ncbi:MAG: hypothetical protein ACYCUI_15700, partial [Vulcanimicrobiaceae bacterium]
KRPFCAKMPQNAHPGTSPVPSAHAASSDNVHRMASREFRNLLNGEQIPLDVFRLGPDWVSPEIVSF